MIRIGLTGGIGSGKTTVASLLAIEGIPVYIADEESKKLSDTSLVIREKLTDLIGKDIYTGNGLNRQRLASLIFGNPVLLEEVNKIIHPVVQEHFLQWCSKQTNEICIIESAILFESGFDKIVDIRLLVYAPIEKRIERVRSRNNLSYEEVKKRINNQLSDEVKKELADFTIYNDDLQALIPQISNFISFFFAHK